ncbi:Helitron helicase [Phytophthora megakarya]|uniref:Helitron helicase n=1 Tax=Phytophthora megakarya TaxID=4795 RepID=A0A225V6N6_9STRA|nr:Helitron helicase [Phytophthora megakarya]
MAAERLTGETKDYLSVDNLEGVADPNMIEQEFLNSLNFSLFRLTGFDAGLCNGTRLRIISLRERSIEATIMSGLFKGKPVFIPRIIFYSEDDDKGFPFKL